ncbi:MAG: hypothetical protein ACRDF0_12020, partial [Candidatus Limnocylindria bacterium]
MGDKSDRSKDREGLADEKPKANDDLSTAEAKSKSVDERVPEALGPDETRAAVAPPYAAPAAHVPPSGATEGLG